MKKLFLILVLSIIVATPVSAGVNDYYFSDFTGDYYLQKDDNGISHLKVIESVTAEFPEYNQNKGICRQISYTNQDGLNVTLPNLTRDNLIVTRNGVPEPIYSIEKEKDYYNVCTGNDDYVLGTQVYTFEYEFVKVVTDFKEYQELYWDTNGNGAMQRFDKVTARVHFDDKEMWTGQSWCYVGSYGKNEQNRCTTKEIDDGVEFVAKKIPAGENLTFDVEIPEGTFVVPEPESNYTYVWLCVLYCAVCALIIVYYLRKYLAVRDKERYYKGLFVKPEYQPHSKYSLPEMSELFIGKKKDVKVAMLLELVVKRKIELQKREKSEWNILIKSLSEVDEEYLNLLRILNNDNEVNEGDTVKVESHSVNSKLIALRKKMESKIVSDLKRDKLVEKKYHFGKNNSGTESKFLSIVMLLPVVFTVFMIVVAVMEEIIDVFGLVDGGKLIFENEFYLFVLSATTITSLIVMLLSKKTQRYVYDTKKGLEMSRYMDGLKMYIEMAEAERMKLLQSVNGADTSAEGIVKLYEKLLPYAAVFGLEESWMDEMKEYCKVEEIEEPDYLMAGLMASELSRSIRSAASYASTSTVMASSGGGSSSGFSGGGGGGFSGGGGGGGGFSGR